MAEGGGTKVLRGVSISFGIVAVIVLVAVFWQRIVDAIAATWELVVDSFPNNPGQAVAVLVYLVLAVVMAVFFSRAGHFTAYGIVMGLWPLLWFLFWEGFPLLGLQPTWTSSLGLGHLAPGPVVVFAVLADLIITLVFVPLELREKTRRRR